MPPDSIRLLTINACAYCGDPIEGRPGYSFERDGCGTRPVLPLCVRCGSGVYPTGQQLWSRFAMADDDGVEHGPRPGPCVAHRGPNVHKDFVPAVRCAAQPAPDAPRAIRLRDDAEMC